MVKLNIKRRKPSITTSSMSDIGFLLLIFIMLISLMNQRKGEKIQYSEALALEKTQEANNFEIWIQENGIVSVQQEIVTPEQLEALLVTAKTEHPDIRVHILADKNTSYKHINGVISVLQQMQHRVVSFVIKEK